MVQCSAALRQQPQWWKHFRVPETRKEWEGWALGRKWCVHTPTGHVEVELSAKQVWLPPGHGCESEESNVFLGSLYS